MSKQNDLLDQFNPVHSEIERKFLEKRQIYLWGGVDDDSARYLIDRLLYLEAMDPGKDITLFINSPGGVITSGMAVVDTMHMISSDVSTVCMGLAASMGAVLLTVGTKGKRMAWPHARIMIHQPLISGQIVAPAIDIKIHAEEIRKTREEINRIIAETTGKPMEQVEKDTDRDFYLTSQEAMEYGIIDSVMESFPT
ncbi:MAG: ATP-dependent Clp protease proteolytic subunit [Spirochaetaceae bacterium]|nr:ATP-dependent Clp protease proteolytic subunit [Spirochaetaceae bacterium]|tara:strand:- start:5203 stop:5790 length:588 start_codon:yes stop_codon:yes gene_type:complete